MEDFPWRTVSLPEGKGIKLPTSDAGFHPSVVPMCCSHRASLDSQTNTQPLKGCHAIENPSNWKSTRTILHMKEMVDFSAIACFSCPRKRVRVALHLKSKKIKLFLKIRKT